MELLWGVPVRSRGKLLQFFFSPVCFLCQQCSPLFVPSQISPLFFFLTLLSLVLLPSLSLPFSPSLKFCHPPWFCSLPCIYRQPGERFTTTRKPEKSNGITDGKMPSVIYTDGYNSISKSVGIYRRNMSVGIYRRFHRRNIHFVWKYATAW